MFATLRQRYDRTVDWLSGLLPESVMLLFVRIALAGVFWRSGRSKLEEGSWFTISDTSYELFRTEYAGVPLPPDLATVAATGAEHLFPILLVLGLFTRLSAFALLVMTLVIQIFVYPEAWWPVHALWVALALALIVRGGGLFSLDTLLARRVRR
jgi:putative oxidoreductase